MNKGWGYFIKHLTAMRTAILFIIDIWFRLYLNFLMSDMIFESD